MKFDFKEVNMEIKKLSKFAIAKQCLEWGRDNLHAEITNRKTIPYDTGAYQKSWKKKKIKKQTITIETPMGQLMIWLEFTGTIPHIIVPVRAKALHWIDRKTGKDVFAMEVHHPGTQAQPHIRPAIKTFMPKWRDYIFKLLKQEHSWVN